MGLVVANVLLPLFGWSIVFTIFASMNALSLLLLFMFENGGFPHPIPRSSERPLFSQASNSRSRL